MSRRAGCRPADIAHRLVVLEAIFVSMPRMRSPTKTSPPALVKPQLAALVKTTPDGPDWLHEIKMDGYRMHARFDAGRVNILTRRGNDWTSKYPSIAEDITRLRAKNAYLDGELCGVLADGRTAFNLVQNTSDTGQGALVFFVFDVLHLNGENLMAVPLVDRKAWLEKLLTRAPSSLVYTDHQIQHFTDWRASAAWKVSSRSASMPDRRSWLKTKCLNREEFVVGGWSDPEGGRHRVGSLLLCRSRRHRDVGRGT